MWLRGRSARLPGLICQTWPPGGSWRKVKVATRHRAGWARSAGRFRTVEARLMGRGCCCPSPRNGQFYVASHGTSVPKKEKGGGATGRPELRSSRGLSLTSKSQERRWGVSNALVEAPDCSGTLHTTWCRYQTLDNGPLQGTIIRHGDISPAGCSAKTVLGKRYKSCNVKQGETLPFQGPVSWEDDAVVWDRGGCVDGGHREPEPERQQAERFQPGAPGQCFGAVRPVSKRCN